jgi:hypothetical protein
MRKEEEEEEEEEDGRNPLIWTQLHSAFVFPSLSCRKLSRQIDTSAKYPHDDPAFFLAPLLPLRRVAFTPPYNVSPDSYLCIERGTKPPYE